MPKMEEDVTSDTLEESKKEKEPLTSPKRAQTIQRSEQVNNFLNNNPPWMVQKGMLLFLVIILTLIAATWFIDYPDIVFASAKIYAANPPKEVIAKTNGRLVKLLKHEGDMIKKKDILGFIESTSNHEQVIKLHALLNELKALTDKNHLEELSDYWDTHQTDFSELGDLQGAHQTFVQAMLNFKNYLSSGFYSDKKNILKKDLENEKRLYTNLLLQKDLQTQDLDLKQTNYNMTDTLHKKQVYHDVELREQKSQLIGKKMALPNINASLIGNETRQNAIQKEMMDLDNQITLQRNLFVEALFTYMNTIEDWKQKYLLQAPLAGKLAFSGFISENQLFQAGKPVCYITNESNFYTVEIFVPINAISRVKTGMGVNLKFQAYPYTEYGCVKGMVQEIKEVPSDSCFVAKVNLLKGLTTNFNKQIAFKNGLTANAEIISDNKRLLLKMIEVVKPMKGN